MLLCGRWACVIGEPAHSLTARIDRYNNNPIMGRRIWKSNTKLRIHGRVVRCILSG